MNEVSLTIKVLDKNRKLRAEKTGNKNIEMFFSEALANEDIIRIESREFPIGLSVRIDKKIPESNIWLKEGYMEFQVYLDEIGKAYPEGTFSGIEHNFTVKVAEPDLFKKYRNLSVNPLDKHEESTYYPHCTATHESDNHDPRFVARNVIDGVIVPYGHWGWPYTSWGNDRNSSAEIKLDFGRPVLVNRTIIHLRADFPHDNWWRAMTLEFSDGSKESLELQKTGDAQIFDFNERKVDWAKITKLIQCENDTSPFPALTQWALYGKDIEQ